MAAKTAPVVQRDEAETKAYLEAVQEGIRAADEGRKRPYEEVRQWLLSWGSDDEHPAPRRG